MLFVRQGGRLALVFALVVVVAWLVPGRVRADDPDPEPTGGKLKVLSVPEDKPGEPDVVYVPTPFAVVNRMLELARVKKKDVVFDLGCGDGRIVVAAAKTYRCRAVGFEIDPQRVKDTRENIKKNKVEKLATFG